MNPGRVRTIAANDLRRRWRDPVGLLATLAIPVALLVVFRLAFGGIDSGQIPRARLLIVDADESFLSRFVTGAFGQGQLASLVQAVPADSARAMGDLRRNRASAALFIPKGFGGDYLEGRPTRLRLLKNPSERILPSIVEEIVATLADGGTAARDLLREPFDQMKRGTGGWTRRPTGDFVSGVSTDIFHIVDRASTYLMPPAIRVRTERPAGKEGPGFLLIFFPGLVGLALIYLSQVIALDFATERRLGTLRRALSLGNSPGDLFVGKIGAGLAVIALLLLVVFLLGGLLLHLPAARLAAGWGMAVAAAFVILGAVGLLALIPRNSQQANVLTNVVIVPVSFLGGCFFPIQSVNQALYTIGAHSPMGLVVEQLKEVLLGSTPDPARPWLAAASFIGLGLLLLGLSGRVAARRIPAA